MAFYQLNEIEVYISNRCLIGDIFNQKLQIFFFDEINLFKDINRNFVKCYT